MTNFNTRHQTSADATPAANSDRYTIYNMRFCPYAQRAILVALAKGIE